jgi:hypothetical protein
MTTRYIIIHNYVLLNKHRLNYQVQEYVKEVHVTRIKR